MYDVHISDIVSENKNIITLLVYVLETSTRAYFKAKGFLFNILQDVYFKTIIGIFLEPKSGLIFLADTFIWYM